MGKVSEKNSNASFKRIFDMIASNMRIFLLHVATVFTIFSVAHLLFSGSVAAENEPIRVTFISVASEKEVFWGNMTGMAKAAAEDLNIDLEVLYSNRDHIRAVDLAAEVTARPDKPDYLIVVGEKNVGGKSIAIADRARVKTLLFGDLTADEKKRIGTPRSRYLSWIGQRRIDDFGAGYQVARSILDCADRANLYSSDGKLYIFGLAGVFKTSFNEERVRGLKKALTEYPDAVLLQMIPAYWKQDRAEYIVEGLFARYQAHSGIKVGAIWSANSDMAVGAAAAARTAGMVPGKNVFISGIDYIEEGIRKVQSGELCSIVGGHFAEIAWLLVMIHDYHFGKDFLGEMEKTEMYTLTQENADLFMKYFSDSQWGKIDFTRFSRVLNPDLDHYNFSFEEILRQLQ